MSLIAWLSHFLRVGRGVAMTQFWSFPSSTASSKLSSSGNKERQPLAVSMANCSESDPDCFHRRKDQTLSCSSDSDCYETVCLIPLFSEVGTCSPPNKIPFPNHQVSCASFQNLIVTGSPLSDVPVCGNTICLLLLLLQASVPEVQDGSSDILTRKFLGNGPRLYRKSDSSQTEFSGNHRW